MWATVFLVILISCGQVDKKATYANNNETEIKNSYPEKFNKELLESELKILEDFRLRRAIFDSYLKSKNKEENIFTCPSCGYPTLSERRGYDICDICKWEDDGQDDKDADEIWGGPNGRLSLTQSRLLIGQELQQFADSLKGTIITDPDKFTLILEEHNKRMEIVDDKIKGDTDINDPLWDEWSRIRDIIKIELIEINK